MMRLMARIMPSCQDISRSVSDSLDRQLPLHRRMMIRVHLRLCVFCRRYQQQLELLRRGARKYAEPTDNRADPGLSSAAKQRLREVLKGKDSQY
jgi:hypothetical protein